MKSELDLGRFAEDVESLAKRFQSLRDTTAILDGDAPEMLATVMAELAVSVEELRVTEEELRAQDEELRAQYDVIIKAQRELENERKRYRDLFEFAPEAYLVTDAEGTIREANRAAAAMLGTAPHFLIGKPLVVLLTEEMRRVFRTTLVGMHSEEDVQELELRFEPRKRPPFDAVLAVTASRDRDGQLEGLRWMIRDVTEKKAIDARLAAFNAELEQRVAERTAELAAANREKDGLLDRERQALAEAEAAREEMEILANVGERLASSLDLETTVASIARVVVPDLADWCIVDIALPDEDRIDRIVVAHRDEAREGQAKKLRGFPPQPCEKHGVAGVFREGSARAFDDTSFFLPSGTVHDPELEEIVSAFGVESALSVPLIARGVVLGVATFVHAGSGRRYADRGRALMEQVAHCIALALDNALLYYQSQEAIWSKDLAMVILDTFLENTPIGLAFLDTDLRYKRVNATLAAFNGMSVGEHIGRRVREVLPEIGEAMEEHLRQVVETGRPLPNMEFAAAPPTRPEWVRDWLVSFYPVRSTFGELLGVGAVVMDITDHKQAQRELEIARDAAEEGSRAKDRFLAVLSHELRTPLTPVLAALDVIAAGDLPPEVHSSVELARRNVGLEVRLIDDLLDLTGIAKGKLVLMPEPVDVRNLLESVVDNCRSEITEKELTLRTELDATGCCVHADPARLQQVLWNLVKNAIKFVPRGAGEITVSMRNDGEKNLTIEIADNGIGILPEALPKIFDEFAQGEPNFGHRFGGLGLGLAISRKLVSAMGGSIEATSIGPGRGAVFTVNFPTVEPVAADAGRPAADGIVPVGRSGDVRILLVDDHRDTRTIMKLLLERFGYVVTTADSVASAIRTFSEGEFDILISDIGLPDGTGIDLLGKVLEIRPLKAIAVSGFGMEEDIERSHEAGFLLHLTKPVSARRLREAIEEIVEGEGATGRG